MSKRGRNVHTVKVDLGSRSYSIHIGSGLLADGGLLRRHVEGDQAAVITNEVVAPLMLDALKSRFAPDTQVDTFVLPDGEAQKSLMNYERIMDFLIERRHNRSTTLIALGGGVVGDITGFAAATYQRGVRFLQIPTTLLAQVDSSVGGKTAVNHPSGKNLIGAFHQPVAVLADLDLLKTLPDREMRAGLAEVIKYGVIADQEFFDWLSSNAQALLAKDAAALGHAVARSCEIKAQVVAADERESGVRAILNFGHTFGHALESITGYTRLLHGEAIAIGMVMAADLSARLGVLEQAEAWRIRSTVEKFGLPVTPPVLDVAHMAKLMGMDKKVLDGRLRLILARRIGEAYITEDFDNAVLQTTLNAGEALCDG